ncbi:MAG TPA: TonB-dependent receptor [Chitinophagaceae bacterium]|nr:TonB-dependent receptor [Chitinophagaceae bacterium]
MKYSILTVFCILLCSICAPGRNIRLQFMVQDSKKQAIEFAAISLSVDTGKRIGNLTDSLGIAVFDLDSAGSYRAKITATGYKTLEQELVIGTADTTLHFALAASDNALKEVVVTASKPLMRQEDDKTIVDAEQLAEASTNGYEMLEKTPGLFVDQDGNIYLSSTTPASVYINGREMKMSRSDVASMLKNLPPNSIEKIEIMRTPSTKYDASGSGGIVNVVLKKGVKIGLNGSVNATAQQGVYGNQGAGFNLSNNNGNSSSYINANIGAQNTYQQLNTDRVLMGDTMLSQQAYTKYPGQTLFTSFGYNKDLNDKWNIAYDGRISLNAGKSITGNNNEIINSTSGDLLLGGIRSDVSNRNRSALVDQELASTYKMDTSGSEWTNKLSYTFSSGTMDQHYQNSSIAGTTQGEGTTTTKRHFGVFQSDLVRKLKHQITMEAGVKSSLLLFHNDAQYSSGSNKLPDYSRTNLYDYTENINAAYLQGSKTFGGFILKTGARMEHTYMHGQQKVPGDTSFNITRADLFPYVYFSKKIMQIAGYDLRAYLVYRRTISRPTYEQLNPFPKYVDQFMSEIGNPALKPQFTNNYEANISVDERPLFAVGYNDTKDMFTGVFYQADSTVSQAYRSTDNIGSNKEFYLRGLAAIPPGKRYFAVIGAQYNHNVYQGLYEGKPLNFTGENWLFFTYQQLRLDKRSTFTLNGFWRLAGPLQFYELSQMGSLTASLNRKFLKDKLTVALNVTDLFYTNNNRFTVRQGSVDASGSRASDSRRFGINVRYNFGIHRREETDMFQVDAEGKK